MAGTERSDTIFALSTGGLPSGIAVVRLSGRRTPEAVRDMAGRLPPDRRASLCALRAPDGSVLDHALVIVFSAGRSFTGEESAEFHLHGGRAVVAAVLAELGRRPGFRPAEPGEFSLRAFLNGRLDLTALEGLGDLINAETEMQRRAALAQSAGSLERLFSAWQAQLTSIRALIEADLDFSDEGDVAAHRHSIVPQLMALRDDMVRHRDTVNAGEILRSGFRVAIVGKPNAGKSSLLNSLAKGDHAIVTPVAGTTRDVIRVDLDVDGYKVILSDTAGLREDGDAVERIGHERARKEALAAQLVLSLDAGDGHPVIGVELDKVIEIATKADLGRSGSGVISISTLSGQGMDELVGLISHRVRSATAGAEGDAVLTRARHAAALDRAIAALSAVIGHGDRPAELVAEDLRFAADALGSVTGRVDAERVLDEIFSGFCIGK